MFQAYLCFLLLQNGVVCIFVYCNIIIDFKIFYCSYVIMELIETEKDYVKDLGLIVEVRILFALLACMILSHIF